MSPERGRLEDVGITNGDTGFLVKYLRDILVVLDVITIITWCHDIWS